MKQNLERVERGHKILAILKATEQQQQQSQHQLPQSHHIIQQTPYGQQDQQHRPIQAQQANRDVVVILVINTLFNVVLPDTVNPTRAKLFVNVILETVILVEDKLLIVLVVVTNNEETVWLLICTFDILAKLA